MARFLEITSTVGSGNFPAGNYLMNIDKITSIYPDSDTETRITWEGSSNRDASATEFIAVKYSPADDYSNPNASMPAYILDAIKTTSNHKNSVVKLKDFMPAGTEVTIFSIAN